MELLNGCHPFNLEEESMFTSVDKMIAAFVASGVAMLVAGGYVSEEQGVNLGSILTTGIAAAVTAFVTWLVPNKS
jgi:hypothetical protein